MGDELQLMQDGVRDWVLQAARRGRSGLRTASPTVLLSLLCASAFGPLFMVGGVAGAGIAVLSSVGGGVLTGLSVIPSADCVGAARRKHRRETI
jgi:hypothetical protein